MQAKVLAILTAASDATLAKLIVDSFREVEKNYYLKSWKTSELDAGHFVEAVRRFIEHRLSGSYAPVGKTLSTFSLDELKRLESKAGKYESYGIHIPRLLLGVYGIRNKRGVGHLSAVAPNYMDAVYVLSACKWVLAEIIRVESGLAPEDTSRLIDKIVEREIDGMWEEDGERRIIAELKSVEDRVLFALFNRSPESANELFRLAEIGTKPYFMKKLQAMHKEVLLTLKDDGTCKISPLGIRRAEQIIASITA